LIQANTEVNEKALNIAGVFENHAYIFFSSLAEFWPLPVENQFNYQDDFLGDRHYIYFVR
jgi:hypothetical protein